MLVIRLKDHNAEHFAEQSPDIGIVEACEVPKVTLLSDLTKTGIQIWRRMARLTSRLMCNDISAF